MSAGIREGN